MAEKTTKTEAKKYIGYDKDKKEVCYCQANSASEVLNYDDAVQKVEDIKTDMSNILKSVSQELDSIISDANKALIVDGTSTAASISSLIELIEGNEGLIKNFEKFSEEFLDGVLEQYNIIQKEMNKNAYNKVNEVNDVVDVDPNLDE